MKPFCLYFLYGIKKGISSRKHTMYLEKFDNIMEKSKIFARKNSNLKKEIFPRDVGAKTPFPHGKKLGKFL